MHSRRGKNLPDREGTPQVDVIFNQFKTARYLSGILAKVESTVFVSAFVLLIKTIFMLDYLIFHTIQHSYYKYIDEVLKCYDYIGHLDNHYAIALYQESMQEYCEP